MQFEPVPTERWLFNPCNQQLGRRTERVRHQPMVVCALFAVAMLSSGLTARAGEKQELRSALAQSTVLADQAPRVEDGHRDSAPEGAPTEAASARDTEATLVLWQENVENAYPRWSRDGREILFQSNRGGRWQIRIIDREGKDDRAVLADEHNNNFIDWSPDNQHVAFVSDRDGNEEIYLVGVDGKNLRRITNHPARDIHPYWAPDGKSLLFNSNRDDANSFEVYRIGADGSGEQRLTTTKAVETCARYSPDMSRIVYLRGEANDDVYTSDAAFSVLENVTGSRAAEGWPAWFPDGKRIVYSSDETGTFALYVITADGKERMQVSFPRPGFRDARAHVAPDGSAIVFNRQQGPTIGIFILPLKS